MLIHGGFWRPCYDRSLYNDLAEHLADKYTVWNIDYPAGDNPWPTTLLAVLAGYDQVRRSGLAEGLPVAVVGHSAGGHLALWLAGRHRLPSPFGGGWVEGASPTLIVGQAPVADLGRATKDDLGHGAVPEFLGGGPDEVPQRYALADPMNLRPTGIPTVLIHGRGDRTVPLSQSLSYGGTVEQVPGGHFTHLQPGTTAVAVLRRWLSTLRA